MDWEQVNKKELERLYYEENLSDALIAERFGVSKNEVRKKRKEYNISILMHTIDTVFSDHPEVAMAALSWAAYGGGSGDKESTEEPTEVSTENP